MNKILLTTFLLFSLSITGCFKKPENKKLPITKKTLENVVLKAIDGVKSANDSLSNLINYSLPLNPDYNELSIDSSLFGNNRVLFTVLLTYNNPIYSRFAVYNTDFGLELIDKSLNGKIYKEEIRLNGNNFLKLTEDFLSKDIFKLTRISLYKIDSNKVDLVFRTLSKLIEKGKIYNQEISEITNDEIKTKLNSTVRSSIRKKSDVFRFSSVSKRYESSKNLFYNYVLKKISKSKIKYKLPLITDRRTALATVGLTPDDINTNKKATANSIEDFSVNLSQSWKRFDNFMIREHLIKGKKGTRFLNNILGTTISVIKINETEDISEYTKFPFKNTPNPKSYIKSTEKMIYGKSFFQLYQYEGKNSNYLIIIDGSKYTYSKYEKIYNNILNSFKIYE